MIHLRISTLRSLSMGVAALAYPVLQTAVIAAQGLQNAGSQITVIHTNLPGHPTSSVPGAPGVVFDPNPFSPPFIGLAVSIDGQWVLGARTNVGGQDAYLRNGQLVLLTGDATPFAPGETWRYPGRSSINSTGDVLAFSELGGTAAPAANEVFVRIDKLGNETLVAREGALVDSVLPGLPGRTWGQGGPFSTLILTEVGQIGWVSNVAGPTGSRWVAHLGGVVVYEEGTIPPGQPGAGAQPWASAFGRFSSFGFHASADGSVTAMRGLLPGNPSPFDPYDDALAVNGSIVLQQRFPIPGSSFADPIAGIGQARVDPGGNWYAQGANQSGTEWIVRNGIVVASSGQPIAPGTSESWSGFWDYDGNSSGTVLAGWISGASTTNRVVVLVPTSGSPFVVARKGEPIDVDGNGSFDDDAFVSDFVELRLLDDGSVLAIVAIEDGTRFPKGAAFVRIGGPTASCASFNGSGANASVLSCATPPRLAETWTLDIGLDPTTSATVCLLAFAPSAPLVLPPFAPQEILIDFSHVIEIPATPLGIHSVTLPSPGVAFWVDRELHAQGFRLDLPGGVPTLIMTNRIDAVLGF